MVSTRCKLTLMDQLNQLNIAYKEINLGTVDLLDVITPQQCKELSLNLHLKGLQVIEDRKLILVEKIKTTIVEMIHYSDDLPKQNYSDYLHEKLHLNYNHLATVFSGVEGLTIQQYIILNKIEKVKELILYGELNFSEIANKLHYSSNAHMSLQFKKITGLTPSDFKKSQAKRKNLEDL